jgi:predicted DNA-binding transcriptional regulator AlpA
MYQYYYWGNAMDKELLSITNLCNYLGVSRPGLFVVRRDDPNFPKPVLFNKKQLWRRSEIDAYLENTRRNNDREENK